MGREEGHVQLFCDPMNGGPPGSSAQGLSRQEYWSGLPFPSPGDLPNPEIEPRSPALHADALTSEPPGKPLTIKGRTKTNQDSQTIRIMQESQASSCVEEWNSACLLSCSRGDRPLVKLYLAPKMSTPSPIQSLYLGPHPGSLGGGCMVFFIRDR